VKIKKLMQKLWPLVFFFCLRNIPALNAEITNKEIEAHLKNEYNRGFNYYGELSLIGVIELNSRYTFRGGLALGLAKDISEAKSLAGFGFAPSPAVKPLNLSFAYVYNGLPEYHAHSHTILPVISFNARRAGISIGPGIRFTSFFGEPAIFESILSFSGYFNFIYSEKLRIGIIIANFDDLQIENMGAYSLSLDSAIVINTQWTLINELELIQNGSVALSATFYGIAWRGGVKYTW